MPRTIQPVDIKTTPDGTKGEKRASVDEKSLGRQAATRWVSPWSAASRVSFKEKVNLPPPPHRPSASAGRGRRRPWRGGLFLRWRDHPTCRVLPLPPPC